MLYKFRDGINYLTFADKMWIELCSNKFNKKKILFFSMVQIIWVLCGEFFKIPIAF